MSYTHILRTSIIVTIAGLLVGGGYCFMHYALKPTHFVIIGDYRLQNSTRKVIDDLLMGNDIEQLKTQAPYITITKAQLKPLKQLIITYKAQAPLARIMCDKNKELILTEKGLLMQPAVYDLELLKNLLCITLTKTTSGGSFEELAQWIKNLPTDIIDNCAITWHNKTEIELAPLSDKRFSFLITHQTPLHDHFFEKLQILKNQLLEQRKYKSGVIDLRFKRYLVLKKGGT